MFGFCSVCQERLQEAKAATVVKDAEMMEDPSRLRDEINRLIKSPRLRADMADRLAKESRSDAAKRLAEIILEEA